MKTREEMNKIGESFAQEVGRLGVDVSDILCKYRSIHVSVNMANHSNPSSIVVEYEGSPPPLTIFAHVGKGSYTYEYIFINGKKINTLSPRYQKITNLLDDLLKECEII